MNDRYLKGVLTVIAAALVWIAVQLTITPVSAAGVTVKQLREMSAFQKESVFVQPVYPLQ